MTHEEMMIGRLAEMMQVLREIRDRLPAGHGSPDTQNTVGDAGTVETGPPVSSWRAMLILCNGELRFAQLRLFLLTGCRTSQLDETLAEVDAFLASAANAAAGSSTTGSSTSAAAQGDSPMVSARVAGYVLHDTLALEEEEAARLRAAAQGLPRWVRLMADAAKSEDAAPATSPCVDLHPI